jgi:hypothetical protein
MAGEDIQELRQEVEELREVSEDTNRVVHKMRRAVWWGRLWTIAMWVLFFGASGAAYYYYLQPWVTKVEQYYVQFQHQTSQVTSLQHQAQSLGQQAQQFLNQFLAAPSPQSPQVPSSGQ